MFDSSVSVRLPSECQKYRTRCGRPDEEARAEHDVGDAPFERLEQHVVLARVVLEVGVLDDDVLAADDGEGAAQCRPLAAVALRGSATAEDRRDRARSASTFAVPSVEPSSTTTISAVHGDCEHAVDEGGHGAGLVEARHGHRQAPPRCQRAAATESAHGIAANEP